MNRKAINFNPNRRPRQYPQEKQNAQPPEIKIQGAWMEETRHFPGTNCITWLLAKVFGKKAAFKTETHVVVCYFWRGKYYITKIEKLDENLVTPGAEQ